MKGLIVIPTFYQTRHTDYWKALLEMVRDNLGFDLQYTDTLKIPKGTDVVIPFAIPQHNRVGYMPELLNVPKNIKIVAYIRDIQCYSSECYDWNVRMFDRFDVILNACDESFKKWYPNHYEKTIYFPEHFGYYNRYASLPYNMSPKMKCLLSGATHPRFYPLRDYIMRNGSPNKIDCISTTLGKRQGYIKDKYARLLNSYFCCVTDSSIFNYVALKSVEITAAGSLLLTDEVEDMREMGFVPYKHYIPVTKKDVFRKIYGCLNTPGEFEKIRKVGREFTLRNHSVNNRFETLKEVLESL